MCRGCFNQLFLRDEFHSGGIAGLLGKAVGMPTRRAFMAYSVGAASALGTVGAAPAFAADEGADLILRGGTVRPLPGATVASAIAIKGGKVLAVGDESALLGLKTGDTKVVDLAGRTLLPGLIDPHNHTASACKASGRWLARSALLPAPRRSREVVAAEQRSLHSLQQRSGDDRRGGESCAGTYLVSVVPGSRSRRDLRSHRQSSRCFVRGPGPDGRFAGPGEARARYPQQVQLAGSL